jgi:ArsR family transcriptional regulator
MMKRRKVTGVTFATDALERAARVCRATGDIARLRLLVQIMDHECSVTELATTGNMPISTVSQQLRSLRLAHLVKRRRVGKQLLYSISSARIHGLLRTMLTTTSEEIT